MRDQCTSCSGLINKLNQGFSIYFRLLNPEFKGISFYFILARVPALYSKARKYLVFFEISLICNSSVNKFYGITLMITLICEVCGKKFSWKDKLHEINEN